MRTELLPVPLAPEISLHLAGGDTGLFDATGGEFRSDVPPPFWAFVWAGGQALARYVLDHPRIVAGRRVLDIAAGSGVAAIAAARAGAASVEALDLDPAAAEATRRNAAANGVTVRARAADVTEAGPADVVLAGDVFYTRTVADRMTSALRPVAASGALILVGDPGRGYFPERLFIRRAEYTVPVPAALEETETLVTAVWEMRNTMLSPTNKL
ncbi:class I SAM-dependent methyltransferase [Couchioplanes caeruleus]|uniref:Methyltransferase n=2 Tax=Couchioplanes caeruleus TaxID=56438 RepID=A0A1K0GKX5_9ACTN|nr:50S ribosomal protein L11 methyltransferase [Couchioplanes caeruleus]OJF09843.1 methyltransferase [Couchioplanes caeruleus subsp. caeruleus]ROP29723.1 putative nicotinamide N-methyase [Couchioplanes caeruleus]